jgi:pyruvate ferredoxin oxidoreductase delta subunit
MALSVGCTSKPGKARDNKTGSWRVFKPEIDHEICNKCGTCTMICPEVCIKESDEGYPEVDYDYCKGCGMCAEECPKDAIEMKQEEK